MKLSQEWVTKVTSDPTADDAPVVCPPRTCQVTHHVSLLAQRDGLQMISLIPVDPTQQVTVVTVPIDELARAFATLGGRGKSQKKTEAARRNGRKGGRRRRV